MTTTMTEQKGGGPASLVTVRAGRQGPQRDVPELRGGAPVGDDQGRVAESDERVAPDDGRRE
jgi:hypothetical protein